MTITYGGRILDRKLPERSLLMFEFPGPTGIPLRVFFPFFENIRITERGQARLSEYDPISRGGSLFSYLGARSRAFSLTFNMTVPHILQHSPSFERFLANSKLDNEDEQRREFFKTTKFSADNREATVGSPRDLYINYLKLLGCNNTDFVRTFLRNNTRLNGAEISTFLQTFGSRFSANEPSLAAQLSDRVNSLNSAVDSIFNPIFGAVDSFTDSLGIQRKAPPSSQTLEYFKGLAVILWWVNIIRCSVLNKADDPIYGPPLIRIRHGVLFRDVGCICENYQLEIDDSKGMDTLTLLPNQIKVSMSLREVKVGDGGGFQPSKNIKRDNVVGWESVLSGPLTIDPQPIEGDSDIC